MRESHLRSHVNEKGALLRLVRRQTLMEQWTFLTNHAHVLLCIARDPAIRLRDVAALVGITERATQRIVADLVTEGYLSRTRTGRRNQYELNPELSFRHPVENGRPIGALLQILTAGEGPERGVDDD